MTRKGRKWTKGSEVTRRKMRVAVAEGIILATVLLSICGFLLTITLFSATYRTTPTTSRYSCPVSDAQWPDC